MQVKTLVTDIFGSNFYIVSQNNAAIMIDPSGSSKIHQKAQDYLKANNLQLKGVLLTHGHLTISRWGIFFRAKRLFIYTKTTAPCYTATKTTASCSAMLLSLLRPIICWAGKS